MSICILFKWLFLVQVFLSEISETKFCHSWSLRNSDLECSGQPSLSVCSLCLTLSGSLHFRKYPAFFTFSLMYLETFFGSLVFQSSSCVNFFILHMLRLSGSFHEQIWIQCLTDFSAFWVIKKYWGFYPDSAEKS